MTHRVLGSDDISDLEGILIWIFIFAMGGVCWAVTKPDQFKSVLNSAKNTLDTNIGKESGSQRRDKEPTEMLTKMEKMVQKACESSEEALWTSQEAHRTSQQALETSQEAQRIFQEELRTLERQQAQKEFVCQIVREAIEANTDD